MNKNKKIIVSVIIVILIIIGILLAVFLLPKESQNNTKHDVYYENNSEITYVNEHEHGFTQKITIENGSLKVTNVDKNESYQLKSINNIKNIMMLCDGTDSECQRYILLTNNGKVYYSPNNLYKVETLRDFENLFTMLDLDYNITDIGYTSWIIPSQNQSLVIKVDANKEYVVYLNPLKYTLINSNK
ncbi:MAG: hypothetical protein ACI310_03655 [Bacilli bacterium]